MELARPANVTAPADGSPTRLQVQVAVLCGLVLLLDGYDLSAIGLAVPSLVRAWQLPPAAFTQAFALSSVGIMVGAMLAGPVADRFGRKPMLIASVATFGVFSLASAYATSLPMLVVLRFLTGCGIGGAMPVTVALTSDHTPARWRSSFVMFMFCGATLGGFIAGQVTAQILPVWGWPGIFLIGGAVPLVLAPLLWFALPESREYQAGAAVRAPHNPVGALFRGGLATTTLLVWVIFLLNLLDMYLITYWLPTVLNLGGLSPAAAASAASVFAIGGVISTLLLGPLMDRGRPERVLAANLVLGVVCVAVLELVHPGPLLTTMVLLGTGSGFTGSQLGLNGFVAAIYPADRRATGIGWALGIGRLGGIAGPIVGGALLGLGWPPGRIMLFVCVPGLVTAALLTYLGSLRALRLAG